MQAIHLGFDYLDNGQLVATYAVPVASQAAPKLYTAPPAQVPSGEAVAYITDDGRHLVFADRVQMPTTMRPLIYGDFTPTNGGAA